MSEMFSRRVFLRGLGVVAAAAALTACSSTNEAVNQALIEGAVGGIVAKDCILGTSRFRSASSDVPIYYVGAKIVLTNVSSKSVTLSGDLAASDWGKVMPELAVVDAFKGRLAAELTRRGGKLLVRTLDATLQGVT